MSCQFFDFPNYTELEINFPSNKLNVFLPAQVTLNKHPKVFILSRKLTEVTLAGSITRSSNSKLSNAMDAIKGFGQKLAGAGQAGKSKIEDIRGEDSQCIRIGVMEDNFDFGHILHIGQYKKVQLG